MFNFKNFFKRKKPNNIKEMLSAGMLSKKQFLILTISEMETNLKKTKTELEKLSKKRKK